MNIQLVPRVCTKLSDQSLCPEAINRCGANTDPDLCAVKLIGQHLANPEPMAVAKSLYGFGKDSYHVVMKSGHDYLHAIVDQTKWWWVNDCCEAIGG